MDLSLRPEDEEFALSFRDWLAGHDHRPPAFVDLADEVAWAGSGRPPSRTSERWVGVHWPAAYGGRSATPVQVALYQSEDRALTGASTREPGGHQPGRADAAGPRHRGPAVALHATDPLGRGDLVPALQRTGRRERPCVALNPGDGGRRRLRGDRTEGMDFLCAVRDVGPVPGADGARCGAPSAGHHGPDRRHVRSRRRRPPSRADDGGHRVQRGLPHRCLRACRERGRDRGPWLGRRRVDAGARTATISRSRSRWSTRRISARLYDEALASGALEDPLVSDALASAYLELGVLRLHNLRTLTRSGRGDEPGPESSWVKLQWTTMTQGMADAGLLVTGRDPTSAEAGPWARQWSWSKAASIAGGTSQVQREHHRREDPGPAALERLDRGQGYAAAEGSPTPARSDTSPFDLGGASSMSRLAGFETGPER